mgnify:CR=1 FL=1
MFVTDWLARRASYHPDRVALVDLDRDQALTWAALDARSDGAAQALAEHGVGPGDRVAVLACNRLEQIELFFACARLGAILVPLNWRLAVAELGPILRDAAPAVLLFEEERADAVQSLAVAVPGIPALPLTSWLTGAPRRLAVRAELTADTPAMLLYTSGSTGTPKGAVITHGNLLWNIVNTCAGWDLQADDVTLAHTPLFHTGGWNVLTLPLLHQGGTVLLTRGFDAVATLQAIEQRGVSVLFAVPTMLTDLLAALRDRATDLGSLRWVVSGGAPCPLPLIQAWCALGVPLKQGYGLTEVGPNCFVFPDGQEVARAGTVGLPMPHLGMRLVDEAGQMVPPDTVGELQLRGPTVCAGYWNNPQASAAALSDDGWFSTGDLMRADPQGWHQVVGRRKEMFISGGENVYPGEIERVLYSIPDVIEAAVVPAAHPRWGEVGHAFVALRTAGADPNQITAACRAALAGYKVPRHVTVLSELPKGPTGKIARQVLTERAARGGEL